MRRSGNGTPLAAEDNFDENKWRKHRYGSNQKVLYEFCATENVTGDKCAPSCQAIHRLSEDQYAQRMKEKADKEVSLGRLIGPYPLDQVDLRSACISTRFSVEQGMFVTLRVIRLT